MTTPTPIEFRGLAARLRYHRYDNDALPRLLRRNLPTIIAALDAAADMPPASAPAILTLEEANDPDS